MSFSTFIPPPLVIAGHGTRDQAGAALCAELVQRVRGLLPDVRVEAGFVELTPPGIDTALAEVLTTSSTAVVVPLMIGTGGHVREDIPEAIEAGRRAHPDATVVYTRHLGSPRGLIEAVRQRIDSAVGDWDAAEVAVVVVGRGCSVTEANADHVRLGRILFELGGYHRVVPAFIQVARGLDFIGNKKNIFLFTHSVCIRKIIRIRYNHTCFALYGLDHKSCNIWIVQSHV